MPDVARDPSPASAPTTRRTLRSRVLWAVLLPLALTWLVGSAVALYLAWVLADRTFDRALLDNAYAISGNVALRDGRLVLGLSDREVQTVLFDRAESQSYAVQAADGQLVAGDASLARDIVQVAPGATFADVMHDGPDADPERVRLALLRVHQPLPYVVAVGQTTRSRTELLHALVARSVLPQVLLLLALGAWLRRQVTRELAPIAALQRELGQRGPAELQPVQVAAPSLDVERLRSAVNGLLARIGRGVQAQREFTGNVAHDLRTPLAGIRALAEYGLARDEPHVWREQLAAIVQSEERASRLVDQLLALAMADEASESVKLETVAVDELVHRVLLGYVARADAAGVDLGANGLDTPVRALCSPVLLEGALANLIDNALRYGRGRPATLTVELSQHDDVVEVAVIDNGPGISPEARAALQRRWAQGADGVRLGAGSGLGLAIASRYAELMLGRLELGDAASGSGLRAVLRLRRA